MLFWVCDSFTNAFARFLLASLFQAQTDESSSIIGTWLITYEQSHSALQLSSSCSPPAEFSASLAHWSSASPVNSVGMRWSLQSARCHWLPSFQIVELQDQSVVRYEKKKVCLMCREGMQVPRLKLRPQQQWFWTIPDERSTVILLTAFQSNFQSSLWGRESRLEHSIQCASKQSPYLCVAHRRLCIKDPNLSAQSVWTAATST